MMSEAQLGQSGKQRFAFVVKWIDGFIVIITFLLRANLKCFFQGGSFFVCLSTHLKRFKTLALVSRNKKSYGRRQMFVF